MATAEGYLRFSVTGEEHVAASKKDSANKEDSKDEQGKESEKPSESQDVIKKTAKSKDPIRWFGILVPPALRSTQSNFVSAVEGPVPNLATIMRDMRNQEIEIGRVRKQIKKL